MKLISKNLANRLAGAFLFAVAGSLVVSCAKNTDNNQPEQTYETQISVKVAGIDESPIADNNKKASAAQTESKITSNGDFDVLVEQGNHIQSRSNNIKIKGSTNANGQGLKAVAVEPGITYLLNLYKASDNSFVSSTALTAGTAGNIAVVKGESYKWNAVSYNNTDVIAPLTAASSTVAVPSAKDVLYASGDLAIAADATSVPLAITFKHKVSRIAIELNSMGIFGDMTGATVTVSGLNAKTGDLDLLTGTWSNLVSAPQVIDWTSFENIDPAFNDAKVAYAYTADEATANTITVAVTNLNLTHADGGTRVYAGGNLPVFNVTPVNGSTHVLKANIIESPITTGTGATAVRWARSNLYYTAGHNPYRFYEQNVQTAAAEGKGYFAFGSVIPRKFATSGGIQDPCTLVYPAGVWRQPTHTEFGALTTTDGLLTNVLGNILGLLVAAPAPNATGDLPDGTYIDYAGAVTGGTGNTAFGPESNTLRFNYNGQVTNISAVTDIGVDGLILLNLGTSYGNETAIWTKDQGVNLLGLVGIGAWGYHAANKSTLGVPPLVPGTPFLGAQGTAELLSDVNVLGLNLVSSTFKNVRCVRN